MLAKLEIPELQKYKLQKRMEHDPSLRDDFWNDLTTYFFDEMKFNEAHEMNILVFCWGDSRSGKSLATLSIASQTTKKPPTIDNVFFMLEDLNKAMPRIESKTSVFMDDRFETYGMGQQRLEAEWRLATETLGMREINFFVSRPSPMASTSFHYLIWAMKLIDKQNEINYVALQDTSYRTIGHLELKHPRHFLGDEFIRQYLEKKNKFLDLVQQKDGIDPISEFYTIVINSPRFQEIEAKAKEIKGKRFTGLSKGIMKEIIAGIPKLRHLRRNVEVDAIIEQVKMRCCLERGWSKGL